MLFKQCRRQAPTSLPSERLRYLRSVLGTHSNDLAGGLFRGRAVNVFAWFRRLPRPCPELATRGVR